MNKYLSENTIAFANSVLAAKISIYCRENNIKELVVVSVLNGAVYFTADVTRLLDDNIKQELRCIKCHSYIDNQISETLQVSGDVGDVDGKVVLILDDVYDTGRTMKHLVDLYKENGAAKVLSCVFIDKVFMHEDEPNAVTFSAHTMTEPGFLVGYGLDDNEHYRNLTDIYIM